MNEKSKMQLGDRKLSTQFVLYVWDVQQKYWGRLVVGSLPSVHKYLTGLAKKLKRWRITEETISERVIDGSPKKSKVCSMCKGQKEVICNVMQSDVYDELIPCPRCNGCGKAKELI